MFGIFYMLYSAVIGTVAKIDEGIDNNNRRYKAKAINDDTYYDHKNQLRLTANDRLVSIKTVNHDQVIVDTFNGKIYKNISKEREDKKKEEAMKDGKTVIYITKREWGKNNYQNQLWYKAGALPRYKDIKTGAYYINILINGLWFYMDVNTGRLIRLVDGEDLKDKKFNVSVEDIIQVFNISQEKIKRDKRFPEQWWWVKSAFYHKNKIININDDLEIIER